MVEPRRREPKRPLRKATPARDNSVSLTSRPVWICPECRLKHYYDPKGRCRLPCGYVGHIPQE